MTTATYTETGDLYVTHRHDDGSELRDTLGHYDADGGEWIPFVDAMLAKGGYARTGDWDGDNAPVRETR